jgi:hypothetical protein
VTNYVFLATTERMHNCRHICTQARCSRGLGLCYKGGHDPGLRGDMTCMTRLDILGLMRNTSQRQCQPRRWEMEMQPPDHTRSKAPLRGQPCVCTGQPGGYRQKMSRRIERTDCCPEPKRDMLRIKAAAASRRRLTYDTLLRSGQQQHITLHLLPARRIKVGGVREDGGTACVV